MNNHFAILLFCYFAILLFCYNCYFFIYHPF